MSQSPAVIDLSSLNGTTGFKLFGEQVVNSYLGTACAGGGDINGDGFFDFLIGDPRANPNGKFSAGAGYVVFGSDDSFGADVSLATLCDGIHGFRVIGHNDQDRCSFSIASAGDVNGDGYDDILLGAPDGNGNGMFPGSGAAYVVFGKADGFSATLDVSALDGNNGFQIAGPSDVAAFASAVSSAGDINGDGYDDVLVFCANPPNGSYAGAGYVVFGKSSGFSAQISASALDGNNGFRIDGAESSGAGNSISPVGAAGDINGDGIDDLIIGFATLDEGGLDSGKTFVVFGNSSGFDATLSLGDIDGSNGFALTGEFAFGNSGGSVASAGDVNGDGLNDIIIGARYADDHGSDSGAAYVVFGSASGFDANIDLADLDGTNGFQITGDNANDRAGIAVSDAGDFNGDGFGDVLVGVFEADPNGNQSGAAYIVFGKANFGATIGLGGIDGNNGIKFAGEVAYDYAGCSVAGAGDINGDGFADVVVGAFRQDATTQNDGAAYLVYGGMPEEAVARTGTAIDNTIHGSNFDDTLTGLGGDDHLIAHDGNDTLSGGTGGDILDGGNGIDTVTFVGASGAVNVSLSITTTQSVGGGQGSDTLSGIENLIGSAFADTLTGDSGNNVLAGQEGDDILAGGVKDDTLDGGDGIDTVDYTAASGGVRVNLAIAGAQTIGSKQGTDTLIAIENVNGSNFADTLAGDGNANTLSGGAGTDTLVGGLGDDTLDGGADTDTANYASATAAINANLATHSATGDGTDTFVSIENLAGSAFDDALTGDDLDNTLLGLGGADTLAGGAGNDTLDGGTGIDVATYIAAAGAVNVNLSITTAQAVGGGQGNDTILGVENLYGSLFSDRLTGNNSANTLSGDAGNDRLDGGGGNDVLDGGFSNDTFILSGGGNDTAYGGAGSGADTFDFGAAFTAADTVDGGNGAGDRILLAGDYSAGVSFHTGTMKHVESIVVGNGFDYRLESLDANLARSKTLTVDGTALDSGHTLRFDGSREKDGLFHLLGGAGGDNLSGGQRSDTITGGDGDDLIAGGRGADVLDGGLGADTFRYDGSNDSVGKHHDRIAGFDAAADRFNLTGAVTAVDATITSGALSTATFDVDLANAADHSHLGKHHAVLFTPDSGDRAGMTFLVIDLDGHPGYSAAHDLVIRLDGATNLDDLDTGSFI